MDDPTVQHRYFLTALSSPWDVVPARPMPPTQPTVSVILIVRNEERHISDCLAQITAQDYPKDRLEIVVADGMSTDRTRELVEAFPTGGIPVHVVLNPTGDRAHGLNLAIEAARGHVIARVDARTLISPDYLSRCVRVLRETQADNVGGVLRAVGRTPTPEAIALAMSHPFGVGNAQFRRARRSGLVDTVYPGCFRREVFDRVGLFDEEAPVISEDSDLNYRIRRAGGRVYLDASIVVCYQVRETVADLWKLYFRYGGARAGTLLKHGRLFSFRQVVPPALVLGLLALAVLSVVHRIFIFALTAAAGAYVLALMLVAGALTVERRKPYLFGRLLLVFPCMHFGWALGFWRRLLQRPAAGAYWPH